MKNKKAFKIITISATSLAVSAAAVASPLVVMSNINSNKAQKKDAQVNATSLRLYDINNNLMDTDTTYTIPRPDGDKLACKYIYVYTYDDQTGQEKDYNGELTSDSQYVYCNKIDGIPGLYAMFCTQWGMTRDVYTKLKYYAPGATEKSESATYHLYAKDQTELPSISWVTKPTETLYKNALYYQKYQLQIVGSTEETIWNSVHVWQVWNEKDDTLQYEMVNVLPKPTPGSLMLKMPGNIKDGTKVRIYVVADDIVINSADVETDITCQDNPVHLMQLTTKVGLNQSRTFYLADALGLPVNVDADHFTIPTTGYTNISVALSEDGGIDVTGNSLTTSAETISVTATATSGYKSLENGIPVEVVSNALKSNKEIIQVSSGSSTIVNITKSTPDGDTPYDNAVVTASSEDISIRKSSGSGNYVINVGTGMSLGSIYSAVFSPAAGEESTVAPTEVYLVVVQSADYDLIAQEDQPHDKIGTSSSPSYINIRFTPVNTDVAEEIYEEYQAGTLADNWEAEFEGTNCAELCTGTVYPAFSVDGSGKNCKLVVNIQNKGEMGSGVLNVRRKNDASKHICGSRDFIYSLNNIVLSGWGSSNSITRQPFSGGIYRNGDGLVDKSTFTWSVSDTNYATIDQNGVLTPLQVTPEGKTITIKAVDKLDTSGTSYDEVKMTITDVNLKLFQGPTATKTEITQSAITDDIANGYKLLNLYSCTDSDPSGAIIQDKTGKLKYESSNTDVADFDTSYAGSEHKLVYNGKGTTHITASFKTGEGDQFWHKYKEFDLTLTSEVYNFEGTETGTQSIKKGDTVINNIPWYKSDKLATPHTLVIKDHSGTTMTDLTKFTYQVDLLDANSPHVVQADPTDAPISVSANGVVTFKQDKTGWALITAVRNDQVDPEIFYAVYNVVDSPLEIGGWTAGDTGAHLSEDGVTLTVKQTGSSGGLPSGYTVTKWESSNDTIIKIDDVDTATPGKLTYLQAGTVTITATVTSTYSTSTMLVTKSIKTIADTLAPDGSINGTIGQTIQSNILVNGSYPSTSAILTYEIDSSSPQDVASVNSTGTVTLLKAGTTKLITHYAPRQGATSRDVETTITVSVSQLLLNYTWIVGDPNTDSVVLKAYADGQEIPSSDLTFSGYDSSVCTVDNVTEAESGKVKGKIRITSDGKEHKQTTIKVAYTAGGVEQTTYGYCTVFVRESHLTLSQNEIHAQLFDDDVTLKAYVNGKQTTEHLTFSTESSSITVSSAGVIKFVSVTGESTPAIIKVKYSNGLLIEEKECKVYITAPTLTINVPTNLTGIAGQTRQVKFYVNKVATAITKQSDVLYLKGVKFEIAKTADTDNVCTIDDTGKITFVGQGTTFGKTTITFKWYINGESETPMSLTVNVQVIGHAA